MTAFMVEASEWGAYAKTLRENTVDTVTFAQAPGKVEIINTGSEGIYLTIDGTTPTIAGAGTIIVPANSVRVIDVDTSQKVVKLISSGTPEYSVAVAA